MRERMIALPITKETVADNAPMPYRFGEFDDDDLERMRKAADDEARLYIDPTTDIPELMPSKHRTGTKYQWFLDQIKALRPGQTTSMIIDTSKVSYIRKLLDAIESVSYRAPLNDDGTSEIWVWINQETQNPQRA